MSIETPTAGYAERETIPAAPSPARSLVRRIAAVRLELLLVVAVFVVAMIPRVAWIEYNDRPPKGLNDPALYIIFADIMADGGGYSNLDGHDVAYYPVGFPATMAGLRKAQDLTGFDRTVYSAKLMNGIFNAVTVAMIYVMARRLFDRRIALASGALLAIFPSQVFYTGTLLSEPQFTMLFIAAILTLVWHPWSRDGMSWKRLAVAGLILSAATMTRGITLIFPLVLACIWLFYLHSKKRALLQTLVLFAGIAVLTVPWAIRNTLVFDTLTGPSTNLGDDLCIGNAVGATGSFMLEGKCFEGYEDTPPERLEVERNQRGLRTAVKDVIDHPGRMRMLTSYKAYELFYKDDDGLWAAESYGNDWHIDHPMREILSFAANSIYYATGALAVIGLVAFAFAKDIRRAFIVLSGLYVLALPLFFFGDPRFHYPAIPLMVIVAMTTLIGLWDQRKRFRAALEPSEPPV